MDFEKLLATQFALDTRILKKRGLTQEKVISNEVLALLVELGEMAQDQRSWKFWSTDLTPRPKVLEEACDCLHFFLSIANYLEITANELSGTPSKASYETPVNQFVSIFGTLSDLNRFVTQAKMFGYAKSIGQVTLRHAFSEFLGLVNMIGISFDDLENEYYRKNEINHERQATNY